MKEREKVKWWEMEMYKDQKMEEREWNRKRKEWKGEGNKRNNDKG